MDRYEHGWFDQGQICHNGHIVNQEVVAEPALSQGFCALCGTATIVACPHCGTPIRGMFHPPGSYALSDMVVPAYCLGCGKSYPWTTKRVKAAHDLADELHHLKPQERELLKQSIDDLISETPQTAVATLRFKQLLGKAGADAAGGLKEILVGVVTEAVRRGIWGV